MANLPDKAGLRLAALVLAAGCAFAASADQSCVLPLEQALEHAHPAVLLAVSPEVGQDGLQFHCAQQQLEQISFRLAPGQTIRARVVAAAVDAAELAGEGTSALLPAWVHVQTLAASAERSLVEFSLRLPETEVVGQRWQDELVLDNGQRIGLTVESVAGGMLFRDDFKIEPVIGQFSVIRR